MKQITLNSPFDGHLHLRDGEMLTNVLPFSARQFAGAIVMPNLIPPLVSAKAVWVYREEINIFTKLSAWRDEFMPFMTCYLTDESDPADLRYGFERGFLIAGKLYPPHGTTNSAHGVTNWEKMWPVLETMEEIGMTLCVHGETPPDPSVDIFDREKEFIEKRLMKIVSCFPKLKIVFEHVTTSEAAEFVAAHKNMMATVTPQHLLFDRNALFQGGLQPDLYCMPILKKRIHKEAVQKFVATGHPQFALGTDSAPHLKEKKYQACGCAGVFSAPVALEAYAMFFEEHNALDKFPAFACEHLPNFYGIKDKLPKREVVLQKSEAGSIVPKDYTGITPLFAGEKLYWKVV